LRYEFFVDPPLTAIGEKVSASVIGIAGTTSCIASAVNMPSQCRVIVGSICGPARFRLRPIAATAKIF